MASITASSFLLNSLSVYRHLLKDPVVSLLNNCLAELNQKPSPDGAKIINDYSNMCAHLYESEFQGNLYDYIFDLVRTSLNVFTKACANNSYFKITAQMKNAAKQDLNVLYAITLLSSEKMKTAFKTKAIEKPELIDLLPDYSNTPFKFSLKGRWGEMITSFNEMYRNNGIGAYAKYKGFSVNENLEIVPVKNPDPIRMSDLKRYKYLQKKIVDNTLAFIKGQPYQNVLLYGDRGTGKSSTVKALLNEYSDKGLRLIEISVKNLTLIDKLLVQIEEIPMKFILFIDDLSFGENDQSFGILKALLEGSLTARPDNVAVYATSNRRHLVKESFSEREGDDVHKGDTIDEILSLSDRFGLTVTFSKPNKNDYLDIVLQIAKDREIDLDDEILTAGAERFALGKSVRTPRVARQYIDHVQAKMHMNAKTNEALPGGTHA